MWNNGSTLYCRQSYKALIFLILLGYDFYFKSITLNDERNRVVIKFALEFLCNVTLLENFGREICNETHTETSSIYLYESICYLRVTHRQFYVFYVHVICIYCGCILFAFGDVSIAPTNTDLVYLSTSQNNHLFRPDCFTKTLFCKFLC